MTATGIRSRAGAFWAAALPLALTVTMMAGCQSQQNPQNDRPIEQYVNQRLETIDSSEQMAAQSFTLQISAGAQQYLLKTGKQPQGFTDFVANGIPADSDFTVDVASLGKKGGCKVTPTVIDCTDAFNHYTVRYLWQDGGAATGEITPKPKAPSDTLSDH